MTSWSVPVAVSIGFFFVYLNNKKTEKKLKDHFDKKEKEAHKSKATKRNDENIHKDR